MSSFMWVHSRCVCTCRVLVPFSPRLCLCFEWSSHKWSAFIMSVSCDLCVDLTFVLCPWINAYIIVVWEPKSISFAVTALCLTEASHVNVFSLRLSCIWLSPMNGSGLNISLYCHRRWAPNLCFRLIKALYTLKPWIMQAGDCRLDWLLSAPGTRNEPTLMSKSF